MPFVEISLFQVQIKTWFQNRRTKWKKVENGEKELKKGDERDIYDSKESDDVSKSIDIKVTTSSNPSLENVNLLSDSCLQHKGGTQIDHKQSSHLL